MILTTGEVETTTTKLRGPLTEAGPMVQGEWETWGADRGRGESHPGGTISETQAVQ